MKTRENNITKHECTSTLKPFLADLPNEIIQEILRLLPVKTLIRLKCVCKSWFYLISTPHFINSHLQKSNNYDRQRLVLSQYDITIGIRNGPAFSLKFLPVDDTDATVTNYREDPCRPAWIVGSCNGLVCFTFDKAEFILYNPATKMSKKLPRIGIQLGHHTSVGFGYDRLNDDYKLVHVTIGSGSKVTDVYSLKSNFWKNLGDLPFPPILNCEAIYVNGILHWDVVIVVGVTYSWIIVSFDLGNESYGEIAMPCFGDEAIVSCLCLGVLEGCLSICCCFENPYLNEIWVMKEYGVVDTWIKLWTIPDSICYFPLCITMTGEILLKSFRTLVLYNPTNGVFGDRNTDQLSNCFKAVTYFESLVSPNIYDEVPTPKSPLQGDVSDELISSRVIS